MSRKSPHTVCTVEGCDRPHCAHGMCDLHRSRVRRTGSIEGSPSRRRSGCLVAGCTRPHKGRGLCLKHWAQWYRTGAVEGRYFRPPEAGTQLQGEHHG